MYKEKCRFGDKFYLNQVFQDKFFKSIAGSERVILHEKKEKILFKNKPHKLNREWLIHVNP